MTNDSHPIALLISGLAIAYGAFVAQHATEIELVEKLLSMGGGAVGVVLMGIGLRYMVKEKNAEKTTREAAEIAITEVTV